MTQPVGLEITTWRCIATSDGKQEMLIQNLSTRSFTNQRKFLQRRHSKHVPEDDCHKERNLSESSAHEWLFSKKWWPFQLWHGLSPDDADFPRESQLLRLFASLTSWFMIQIGWRSIHKVFKYENKSTKDAKNHNSTLICPFFVLVQTWT